MSLLALWSFPMLTCKMAPSATGTRHRSIGICQWNSRIKEENITGELKATAAWEMAAAAAAFPTNPFDLTLDWTVSRCVPHSVHRHADFRWSSPLLFGTCPGPVPSQRMSYHMEAHLPCPQRYTDTQTHRHTDTLTHWHTRHYSLFQRTSIFSQFHHFIEFIHFLWKDIQPPSEMCIHFQLASIQTMSLYQFPYYVVLKVEYPFILPRRFQDVQRFRDSN